MAEAPVDQGPPSPPARRRWTQVLVAVAVAVLVGDVAAGLISMLVGRPIPLHVVLGVFLACFSALKFAVATDALLRLRHGVPDPRATHGSAGMVWGWVIYKYTAALVSGAVAIYVFTAAAERVDAMMLR